MGTLSILQKTKRLNRVYSVDESDEVFNRFKVVITPINNIYYIQEVKEGYKITGEGFVFCCVGYEQRAKEFVKQKNKEIDLKKIKFVWEQEKGGVENGKF